MRTTCNQCVFIFNFLYWTLFSLFSLLFFNSFHTLFEMEFNIEPLLWFTSTLFLLLLLFSVMLILLNAKKKEFARSFNGPFYRYFFSLYVGQCFIPCRPMHSWLLCRIYQRKFPVILLWMSLRIWTEFSFMLSFVSTTIQTIVDWAVNICFFLLFTLLITTSWIRIHMIGWLAHFL